jgi:GNAT superfamily N-acetyltransferase
VIFPAMVEAAERDRLILVRDGMLRWHLRKDGVVVIREIIVLPFRQRTGVGRAMLAELRAKNPGRPVRARCPAHYESNHFWRKAGFRLVSSEKGVNLWELCP